MRAIAALLVPVPLWDGCPDGRIAVLDPIARTLFFLDPANARPEARDAIALPWRSAALGRGVRLAYMTSRIRSGVQRVLPVGLALRFGQGSPFPCSQGNFVASFHFLRLDVDETVFDRTVMVLGPTPVALAFLISPAVFAAALDGFDPLAHESPRSRIQPWAPSGPLRLGCLSALRTGPGNRRHRPCGRRDHPDSCRFPIPPEAVRKPGQVRPPGPRSPDPPTSPTPRNRPHHRPPDPFHQLPVLVGNAPDRQHDVTRHLDPGPGVRRTRRRRHGRPPDRVRGTGSPPRRTEPGRVSGQAVRDLPAAAGFAAEPIRSVASAGNETVGSRTLGSNARVGDSPGPPAVCYDCTHRTTIPTLQPPIDYGPGHHLREDRSR